LGLLVLLVLLLVLLRPVGAGRGYSAVNSLEWVLDAARTAGSVTAAGRHEERYVDSHGGLGIDTVALHRCSAARGAHCVSRADVAKPHVLQPVHHVGQGSGAAVRAQKPGGEGDGQLPHRAVDVRRGTWRARAVAGDAGGGLQQHRELLQQQRQHGAAERPHGAAAPCDCCSGCCRLLLPADSASMPRATSRSRDCALDAIG
jgi:hypothetical protein